MRIIRGIVFALVAVVLVAASPVTRVTVKVIAINDFHGYLQPTETFALPDPADPKKSIAVPVGGAAYLATAIARLKSKNIENVVVGAGDMVGASQLTSALFHDEPTIEALNAIGLEYTSVGNHEFDQGRAELRRKQNGGCRPGGTVGVDTCMTDRAFAGAKYEYLAANVIDDATGQTLFPPYAIKYFYLPGGYRVGVAFVGVVLRDTPSIVTAAGVRGVHFTDEAAAVNAQLPAIAAAGVHAVVVLIHQGIGTTVGYDDHSCKDPSGDLLPVLDKLDPSIKLVISGHTHRAYICPHGEGTHNPNVFYTSAGRYGQLVTDIDLVLDVATDTIADIHADNELVVNDVAPNPIASTVAALPPDPAIAALVARYAGASAPLVNRVVGKISADIVTTGGELQRGASGETPMSDVVADSRLFATQAPPGNAQLAFINGGGVRAPLTYASALGTKQPGEVTFGDVYAVEPFGDQLITETLTGAQVLRLLDQQWIGKKDVELLGIAGGLTYTWDAKKPDGASKVVPGSVRIHGVPIDPKAHFRVTTDAFMMGGGDNYTVFSAGTAKTPGPTDLEALEAYLAAKAPLAPPPQTRVKRLH